MQASHHPNHITKRNETNTTAAAAVGSLVSTLQRTAVGGLGVRTCTDEQLVPVRCASERLSSDTFALILLHATTVMVHQPHTPHRLTHAHKPYPAITPCSQAEEQQRQSPLTLSVGVGGSGAPRVLQSPRRLLCGSRSSTHNSNSGVGGGGGGGSAAGGWGGTMREMRGFLLWMAVILVHMVQVPMLWFVFWQVTRHGGVGRKRGPCGYKGGRLRGVRGRSGCAFSTTYICTFFSQEN